MLLPVTLLEPSAPAPAPSPSGMIEVLLPGGEIVRVPPEVSLTAIDSFWIQSGRFRIIQ